MQGKGTSPELGWGATNPLQPSGCAWVRWWMGLETTPSFEVPKRTRPKKDKFRRSMRRWRMSACSVWDFSGAAPPGPIG